jgi:hypothetical protein
MDRGNGETAPFQAFNAVKGSVDKWVVADNTKGSLVVTSGENTPGEATS